MNAQTAPGSEPFTFGVDYFDSRDIMERIEFLAKDDDLDEWDAEELEILRAFQADASRDVEDWQYGATFISDDHFEEYAEEFAYGIGAIDHNASWPLNHIDWEAASDALKIDYSSFTLKGVTYWSR